MRKLILSALSILFFHFAFSQTDSADILKIFNYLPTEQFKASLKTFTENRIKDDIRNYKAIRKRAHSYRIQQRDRSDFWARQSCFVPDTVYYLPVLSSRVNSQYDSLMFRSFQPVRLTLNVRSCDMPRVIRISVLSKGIIELSCRECPYGNGKIYSEINHLRLKIVNDTITILSREDLFIN